MAIRKADEIKFKLRYLIIFAKIRKADYNEALLFFFAALRKMVEKTFVVIIAAILGIFIVGAVLVVSLPSTFSFGEKIAVIKLEGEISSSSGFLPVATASPEKINKLLDDANKDPTVRAILLEINSPGGSPVASDEISTTLESLNKTVVAYIGDVGASGAYWIAASTDKIVAHPLSLTCSIGAFTSNTDISELLKKVGVNETTIKSGELKDIGSPFKPLTPKEKELLQNLIDEVKDEFLNHVKEKRHLTDAQLSEVSDGRPCLGKQALAFGLVDKTGTKEDAINLIKEIENLKKPKTVEFGESEDLFGAAFGASLSKAFYSIGYGFGDSLKSRSNLIIS